MLDGLGGRVRGRCQMSGFGQRRRVLVLLLVGVVLAVAAGSAFGAAKLTEAMSSAGRSSTAVRAASDRLLNIDGKHIYPVRGSWNPESVDAGPLLYHGGKVMRRTSKNYAIFWEPGKLQNGNPTHVSPNYNSLISGTSGTSGEAVSTTTTPITTRATTGAARTAPRLPAPMSTRARIQPPAASTL